MPDREEDVEVDEVGPDEHGGRLIVVSNRIPKGDVPAGGLIFAIHEALSEFGGLWIGAGDPGGSAGDGLRSIGTGDYERRVFRITHEEHRRYYLGYANSVLWPLFHHRADLLAIEEGDFDAYQRVNARVARSLAEIVKPDDLIWIQDYHFLLVAQELRRLGVTNRIGLFLHIPFPNPSDVMALPQATQLADWIAAHDVFGLQTQRDVASVQEILRQDSECERTSDGLYRRKGRTFSVDAFPIGIDAVGFAEAAVVARVPRLTIEKHAPLLLGVDRLDYSKGLVHRLEAFSHYLEHRRPDSPRPVLLQIAPTSRGDVAAYQEIRSELERTAGAINAYHSDLDWTPVRYVNRHIDRDVIAGLYRRANVALVTPLADGMNLVAKEFIAAQDPEDPGVLILSHFAGASEQMAQALMVNPFDHGNFAAAIDRALTMPLAERRDRHKALRRTVFEQDISWWTRSYLARLAEPPKRTAPYLRAI